MFRLCVGRSILTMYRHAGRRQAGSHGYGVPMSLGSHIARPRRRARRGLVGQSLVLMAIAAVTLFGASALAVDVSGAWRMGAASEQTLELAKDGSMGSLNATKFSDDPGQVTADMVVDQLREDGYVGDYEIWWYELGPNQTGSSDRLAGVEVVTSQEYDTSIAGVIGISEMEVDRNKVWTLNPYSSTQVWRPSRAESAYGQVWRGHMGEGGVTSDETSGSASYPDLSDELRKALEKGLNDLHGGGTDWRPPSYLEGSLGVSGDAVVGGTLAAEATGTQLDASLTYAWYLSPNADGSGATRISGESGQSIAIRPEWVGRTLVCQAIDASANHLGTIASSPVGPIRPAEATGKVTLSGGSAMGETVSASASDLPDGFKTGWQWRRDGSDIATATGSTYQLQPEDVGHDVTCVATDASGAYAGELESAPVRVGKASATVGVTVTGGTLTGDVVTASIGGLPTPGKTDVRWSWQTAASKEGPWTTVSGAAGDTYSPTGADAGRWLRAIADCDNPYWSIARAASEAFGPVAGRPLTGTARMEGEATVTSTLTTSATGLPSDASARYQWYADGRAIDGANVNTYVLTPGELGKIVTCQVTDSSGKYSGNLEAGPVGPVTKRAWDGNSVEISRDFTVGSTATVTCKDYPAGTTLGYEWHRTKDGVDETIDGANTDSLALTADLVDWVVWCRVTASNGSYEVPGRDTETLGPVAGRRLTGTVTVDGNPVYGRKLTASVDGAPVDAALEYQWCVPNTDSGFGVTYEPIDGATGNELLCDVDLIGKTIVCKVTDSSGNYVGLIVSGNMTITKATRRNPSVAVSGVQKVGQTLTGKVTGLPSVPKTTTEMTWEVAESAAGPWTAIEGANGDSLTVPGTVLGKYVRLTVTSENAGYEIPAASSKAMGPVEKGYLTGTVAIGGVGEDGKAKSGDTLTASVTGLPEGAVAAYQWFRDGQRIDGATDASYAIGDDNNGCTLTCQVSDSAGLFDGAVWGQDVEVIAEKQAFAVYSDDDKSLDFYKRDKVPAVGDTFEGKAVTAVYTGAEDTSAATKGGKAPWSAQASKITNVTFVDSLYPTSTAYWFSEMANLATIDLSGFDTSKVEDMAFMFANCHSLASIDVSSFDTSKVSDMTGMFAYCPSLTTLDLSNFDTSKVTSMEGMFCGCSSITSLDVSNFVTSKVEDMAYMFINCQSLASIDVSSFDTSKVTSMFKMLANCHSLASIDVSSFDTSKVTHMDGMFMRCSSIRSLDVSNFVTSKVTGMREMFYGCSRLTTLDPSGFDTSKVTDMRGVFSHCSSLTTLDLSNFDTSKVASMNKIFSTMPKLQTLVIGNEWNWVGSECYPPEPNGNQIAGADGKWYAKSDGKGYAPSEIPSGKADTYYASKALLESAGKAQASIAGDMMPAMLAGRTPSLAMELGM